MRREGGVRGKSTSKTRITGRCYAGTTRCRCCRDHPVEKSRSKRMGRFKRLAGDVNINPSLAEFHLQPSLKHYSYFDDVGTHEIEESFHHAKEVRIFVATVNGVIDAAFSRMHGGFGLEEEETMPVECTACELASGDDAHRIPVVVEAFDKEFGIYENGLEGSQFSETECTGQWEFALSEGSWSNVELSESSSQGDDWHVVDDDDM